MADTGHIPVTAQDFGCYRFAVSSRFPCLRDLTDIVFEDVEKCRMLNSVVPTLPSWLPDAEDGHTVDQPANVQRFIIWAGFTVDDPECNSGLHPSGQSFQGTLLGHGFASCGRR